MNIVGTVGYCVGNLNIDTYELDWEDGKYKKGLLVPADKILIEASNGASDYGNKLRAYYRRFYPFIWYGH